MNNLLGGLRLPAGTLPPPDSRILGGEKPMGRVTTAVQSPSLGVPIALALMRREWTEPGRSVEVEINGERVPAETCALPFVRVPVTSSVP
jgi:aminomethyltransferase